MLNKLTDVQLKGGDCTKQIFQDWSFLVIVQVL